MGGCWVPVSIGRRREGSHDNPESSSGRGGAGRGARPTSYLLASTIVTALVGKLGDLFGRKRVFQAAVVFFVAGSVLCGLAQSMTMLVAAGVAGSTSPGCGASCASTAIGRCTGRRGSPTSPTTCGYPSRCSNPPSPAWSPAATCERDGDEMWLTQPGVQQVDYVYSLLLAWIVDKLSRSPGFEGRPGPPRGRSRPANASRIGFWLNVIGTTNRRRWRWPAAGSRHAQTGAGVPSRHEPNRTIR